MNSLYVGRDSPVLDLAFSRERFMARSPFPAPTRDTRPQTWGCGVVLILIGVVWLTILYYSFLAPDWRLNHQYVETRCDVLDKRLGEQGDEDATSYRPEINVRYTAAGRERQVWTYDAAAAFSNDSSGPQRILDQFVVGRQYPLWYDPDDPDKAVLVRTDGSAGYWIALIPLGCMVLGLVAILGALRRPPPVDPATAADSYQALARSLSSVPGLSDVVAHLGSVGAAVTPSGPPPPAPTDAAGRPSPVGSGAAQSLPMVPDPMFHEQPGAVLAVGIRPGTPAAVAWLKAVALLVIGAVAAIAALLTIRSGGFTTVILLVIAVPALTFGVRNWLVQSRVGPTGVELSSHPIRPGETFEMCVTQVGPLRLRLLRVYLICDEGVTYHQGTATRIEGKCVCRQLLFEAADQAIGRDAPLALRNPVALPPDTMHSFKAEHNTVLWKVRVHGEPAGLPRFDRDFPVVVAPARAALSVTANP